MRPDHKTYGHAMSGPPPNDGPSWPTGGGWGAPPGPPPGPYTPPPYGAPPGGYPPYPPSQGLPTYPAGGPTYGPPGYTGNYKGSGIGLPQNGPGSLASQWRRFGARILDGLIVLPLVAVVFVPVGVHVVHLVQPYSGTQVPTSVEDTLRRVLIEATVGVLALEFLWEAVATIVWGRTPGKALLHIRPLQVIQGRVLPGRLPVPRCWGRAAAYYGIAVAGSLCGLISLLDEAWCLWDRERQCLHDKIASTVVVND